jgi:hypothetical protein
MIRETFAIYFFFVHFGFVLFCVVVFFGGGGGGTRPKRGEKEKKWIWGKRIRGHGQRSVKKWKSRCGGTYGQIAVLLPVLADFLFCDGHRLGRVRLLLHLLWWVARAV